MEEDILLVEDWLENLNEIMLYLEKEMVELEERMLKLYQEPLGKIKNHLKIKQMDEKRNKNRAFRAILSDTTYYVERCLREIKEFNASFCKIDYILTKESYRKQQEAYNNVYDALQKIRLFSFSLVNFMRQEETSEKIRLRETELNVNLHFIIENARKILYSCSYQEETLIAPMDIYDANLINLANFVLSRYGNLIETKLEKNGEDTFWYELDSKSFGKILDDSIHSGFAYETYKELVVMCYTLQLEMKKSLNEIDRSKVEQGYNLESNAFLVIDKYIYQSDILDLYKKDDLLKYRDILLMTMMDRTENLDTEDYEDIHKLHRIRIALSKKKTI